MKDMPYRLIMLTAALILALPLYTTPAASASLTEIDIGSPAAGGADYTYAGNVVTIKRAGDYVIKGESITNTLEIASTGTQLVNIRLQNLKISSLGCAFKISAGNVNLTLQGETELKSGKGYAGLQNDSSLLRIGGTGTLSADGGANGAGIGGGKDGNGSNITIAGGTINARGGERGAGIGGGYNGSGSKITVSGGNLTAMGGKCGAGIGGGDHGSGSEISISGGSVDARRGDWGAGIGGGYMGKGSAISITDGNVTAVGRFTGSGIGGGQEGSGEGITLSGGTVNAIGGDQGACIGGGLNAGGKDIVINGGSVKAVPVKIANAIGGGLGKEAYIPRNGRDVKAQQVFPVTVAGLTEGDRSKLAKIKYNMVGANAIEDKFYLYLPRYLITYMNMEGGLNMNPDYFHILSLESPLIDLKKNGAEFYGLYDAPMGGNKVSVSPTGISEDVVLYARWTPSANMLTVVNGVGSGVYAENTRVTISANPPKQGRQFKEWQFSNSILNDVQRKSKSFMMIMGDRPATITAIYEDAPVDQGLLDEKGYISETAAEMAISGAAVKEMELQKRILEVDTGRIRYWVPANEVNIDELLPKMGLRTALADVKIRVKISEPSEEAVKRMETLAETNQYQIVTPPMEFSITCTDGTTTLEVPKFDGYVERIVSLPAGVDPHHVTTAVILNRNGTVTHTPTAVTQTDDKVYAKISSLTNGIYTILWNPKYFKDVKGHWAEAAINDMGSRLVINGISAETFAPDRDITRSEFAAIIIRALGLNPDSSVIDYSDIKASDWYSPYVMSASRLNIIAGYGNGVFGPDDPITREQAITMIARTMDITGLTGELHTKDAAKAFETFGLKGKPSIWSESSILRCMEAGVITNRDGNLPDIHGNITRAEVAVLVSRLLQKSGLIQ